MGGIGRLLLAAWKSNRLIYVGGVGTGFTDRTATALRKQLDALLIDKPALKLTRKGTRWVTPSLVAEIEFRAWTTDQKLRHASYKGLRDVADADNVLRLDDD